MDASAVFAAFCKLSSNRREKIAYDALMEYADVLAGLYNDIYTSCIKVYYSSYKPKKYKRHGDIVGFNLYAGFASEVTNLKISTATFPNELMPYRGVTREQVLTNVINGQRGSKERDSVDGPWPRSWETKYPNAYSEYSIWSSNENTIDGILRDFQQTAGEKLATLFWKFVERRI